MISSDILRGYNDTIVLSCLLEKDSYGYEVSKQIALRSKGLYQIKETTLYSVFSRLERNGYITSYYGSESLGKRRTYYHLTPLGVQYYQSKVQEWKETQELIDAFIKEDIYG